LEPNLIGSLGLLPFTSHDLRKAIKYFHFVYLRDFKPYDSSGMVKFDVVLSLLNDISAAWDMSWRGRLDLPIVCAFVLHERWNLMLKWEQPRRRSSMARDLCLFLNSAARLIRKDGIRASSSELQMRSMGRGLIQDNVCMPY
jgi:hypothetical protein